MASLGSSRRQRVIVTAIMLPLLVDEIAASVWLLGPDRQQQYAWRFDRT
jgi:hypothetical protein